MEEEEEKKTEIRKAGLQVFERDWSYKKDVATMYEYAKYFETEFKEHIQNSITKLTMENVWLNGHVGGKWIHMEWWGCQGFDVKKLPTQYPTM